MAIQILNDNLVNQIAAGEVVERPASVVKELVENSLDACASAISVSISAGGISAIEVLDNGCGMTAGDARLSLERFATSKITCSEELYSLGTLGFRGEALSSIASVSHFTLLSRVSDSEQATEISIEGGTIAPSILRSAPVGTRMTVKDLFYNVPARKRFLKTERTEAAVIKALLTDFALGYPNVRFRLTVDGKSVLSFSPVSGFFERAEELGLGGDNPVIVENQFLQVKNQAGYNFKALLSAPTEAVKGPGKMHFIVNGRIVKDKVLLRAVREGFGMFLKAGQYPRGALIVNVPSEELDVNVHPQKSEIRFRQSDVVFRLISGSIKKSLSSQTAFGHLPVEKPIGADNKSYFVENEVFRKRIANDSRQVVFSPGISGGRSYIADQRNWTDANEGRMQYGEELTVPKTADLAVVSSFSSAEELQKISSMRYIGQIFKCYLLFEGKGQFVLVDMHAAHERVRFFELKQNYLGSRVAMQQNTMAPLVIEVPSERLDFVEEMIPEFRKMGFDAEMLGCESLVIRAVPSILADFPIAEVLEEILLSTEISEAECIVDRKIDNILARIACHSSIRSGRELCAEEAYALIERLEEVETSGLCPHGRPVCKYFNLLEIEQLFGRVI